MSLFSSAVGLVSLPGAHLGGRSSVCRGTRFLGLARDGLLRRAQNVKPWPILVLFRHCPVSCCRAMTWVGAHPSAGDGVVPLGAHVKGSQGELKTLRREQFLFLSAVSLCIFAGRSLGWERFRLPADSFHWAHMCDGLARRAQNVKPRPILVLVHRWPCVVAGRALGWARFRLPETDSFPRPHVCRAPEASSKR